MGRLCVPIVQSLTQLLFHTLQTDPEGRTAVHYAAFFGKHRSLKFLIESASDWTPKYVLIMPLYGCVILTVSADKAYS